MRFRKPSIPLFLRESLSRGPHGSNLADGETLGCTHVRVMGIRGIWVSVEVEQIEIRSGLPGLLYESTCVHELGHAWLADQKVLKLDTVEEEGFCQLVEHRWLARLPGAAARMLLVQIEQRTDRVYGTGFRIMRQRLVRAGGFRAFLATLRA